MSSGSRASASPTAGGAAGAGWVRLASPPATVVVGVLVVVSLAADESLAILNRQGDVFTAITLTAVTSIFAGVGVVVARREPGNPVGWILAGVGLSFILCTFGASDYLALDYGRHHGRLPLGAVAVVLGACWMVPLLFGPLVILLFPDGRLPSRRWRWVLGAYLVSAAALVAGEVTTGLTAIIEQRVRVDASGNLTSPGPGLFSTAVFSTATGLLVLVILASWLAFLGRQVASYRRSTGERRQQLKWVMCGAAVTAISIPGFISGGHANSTIRQGLVAASVVGLAALPLSIGVGILKYRLYEIDRLISRTLAYAVVTGLLVGLYFSVVTLATDVLPFSSPVAVAASTLAAAALFNPLRRRVQRLVDRRFNRARYDAETTVATFTAQLREALDLDTVRNELVRAVDRSLQPSHASMWIKPPSAPDTRARSGS
jgi:hypothetical protein